MRYEVRDQRGAVGEKLLVCGERKSDGWSEGCFNGTRVPGRPTDGSKRHAGT
jgi:hypothetical protein